MNKLIGQKFSARMAMLFPCVILFFIQSNIFAQEPEESIRLIPNSGSISKGSLLKLYFQESIVSDKRIGRSGKIKPLIFDPKVNYSHIWKSSSEVHCTIDQYLVPGTSYKVKINPKIADLNGNLIVDSKLEDKIFQAPELSATTSFRAKDSGLNSTPIIPLMFNYDIEYSNAKDSIFFQDHDSGEKINSMILLPTLNTKPSSKDSDIPKIGQSFSVQPSRSFPVNRRVDLIVDGIKDARTNSKIPYTKVFPLGVTKPLTIISSRAFQDVFGSMSITINFDQSVDHSSLKNTDISITPSIESFQQYASGRSIYIKGKFNPRGTYKINLGKSLQSVSGYTMEKSETVDVEFTGLPPSIYLPSTMYFTRAAIGLKTKILHANTGQTKWVLAKIPEHKIGVARNRLFQNGELLVDQLSLNEISTGLLQAPDQDKSIYQDIEWKPKAHEDHLNGAYLLELSANTDSGKIIANRSIVFFTELYVAQKRTSDHLILKLQDMTVSNPVIGKRVRLVSSKNEILETAKSDNKGNVIFKINSQSSHVLIDTSENETCVALINSRKFYNSGWTRSKRTKPISLGIVFTDRNLYRPGTVVKFKGIVRSKENDKLHLPIAKPINWKISEGYYGKVVAEGTAVTDELGGWEGEWKIPSNISLGGYRLSTSNGFGEQFFRIEEYRVPLFEVNLNNSSDSGGNTAKINVQSNYFHGGPNSGAVVRWSINWEQAHIPSGLMHYDYYSNEPSSRPYFRKNSSGELRLNNNGSGIISVKIPENETFSRPRYRFNLQVDVLSPEGRTISNGISGTLQPHKSILGMALRPKYLDESPYLELELENINPKDQFVVGNIIDIDVFRIEAQTVKEDLGDGLFRYRNFSDHVKIKSLSQTINVAEREKLKIDVDNRPGKYVVVGKEKNGAIRCSSSITLAGQARARYPIYGKDGFAIKSDKKFYLPGEKASLALEAPFGGTAWVAIETDKVLEQFIVKLDHNANRIDIPIKEEYFPNAFATVYLVKSGGSEKLPVERLGRTELIVKRDELELNVDLSLEEFDLEPGSRGVGSVSITNNGTPVIGSDLSIICVDDAVLKLGKWELPPIMEAFYPMRYHNVSTFHALDNHVESFVEEDVTEKGFLIGGGGEYGSSTSLNNNRKNFLARAFWITGLQTNENGKASFNFNAPDNLTAFRISALAQTKDHQFGKGETTFRVNKRLMIEPALPRFVREGDEINLRAIIRQQFKDQSNVHVSLKTTKGIEFIDKNKTVIGPLDKNVPGIFNAKARVIKGIEEIEFIFSAHLQGDKDLTDRVSIKLPVHKPGIVQSVGAYGKIQTEGNIFSLKNSLPKFWPESEGQFNLTLSRSAFLPKLQSLPELLDYPHGCFEQRTSKLLGYINLANLLEYLPTLSKRHNNYKKTIEEGLNYLAEHVDKNGFLPYWAGSSHPNAYVTVQAAWLIRQCQDLDYKVPAILTTKLEKSLNSIIKGHARNNRELKSFAAFVASQFNFKDKPVGELQELYLNRQKIRDESRAFLAMAMLHFDVMPEERNLLADEISDLSPQKAFDPNNFYSTSRANAVKYIALNTISNPRWKNNLEPKFRRQLFKYLEDSKNLSTQENLWLLMCIRSMMKEEQHQELNVEQIVAEIVSKNKYSVGWSMKPLNEINRFNFKGLNDPIYYLTDAKILRDDTNSKREDRGLRIERVLKNLTDPGRTGSSKNPLKLGDEVLITYRILNDRNHYYVAITDELAASLEVVNFNLPQISDFYSIPNDINEKQLVLDHSELKDNESNLYFNRLNNGESNYSLLARVTSAGIFSWPASTITPMYEPRFSGLSNNSKLFVKGK